MRKKILHLNVKKEYFEMVKVGDKVEEFRFHNPYWIKKLSKDYDYIYYKMGYPKNGDTEKILKFKYNGYSIRTIRHKEFGDEPVEVFAIRLGQKVEEESK
ncbi:MAG: hypothetical protein HUJ87_14850 [Fusobacterium varium]|uniref:hypothetical protein n=1 Tax=Fusobacterium varium TaxID=856 RepID=UPI0024303A0F|nr:hypothetical protein [Fusobacterium varium]MCF0171770.1 hypothetical protein [Fusobacterium varium]